MSLLISVAITNFKCYRRPHKIQLSQSNFFVGANNAGKSAVLKAIHCFFDESQYSPDFINKTELRSKGSGFNRSAITIEFDTNAITTKTLRTNLKRQFGETISATRNFTFRESTNTVVTDYTVNGKVYTNDNVSKDLLDLFSKIVVSYIHPQEADELLVKAQEKLKSRLLSNWGRSVELADTLNSLQKQWSDLRKLANGYLSKGLTQSLQNIWPGCNTKVDLPEKIEDIIGISEIMYRGASDMPDVSLTSQGTGAQSTILYQTHFLLDSDKTLHRGFYYPIWLIEEPESFLHADIIFKLGHLLCSDAWLDNIQMLISTHSPLLLATSKQNAERISWFLMDSYEVKRNSIVSDWEEKDIKEMGILMGDPNFEVYFKTLDNTDIIIIEDIKAITAQKLIDAGIGVTTQLNGSTELRRYFDVLRSVDISNGRKIYFLLDNDAGSKDFKNAIEIGDLIDTTETGFKKFEFENNVYLILLPEGNAMEELFDQHDSLLESIANQIFNSDHTKATTTKNTPATLSRVHASMRHKTATGLENAKQLIRNQQDVKDAFWDKVEQNDWQINEDAAAELISLLQ